MIEDLVATVITILVVSAWVYFRLLTPLGRAAVRTHFVRCCRPYLTLLCAIVVISSIHNGQVTQSTITFRPFSFLLLVMGIWLLGFVTGAVWYREPAKKKETDIDQLPLPLDC